MSSMEGMMTFNLYVKSTDLIGFWLESNVNQIRGSLVCGVNFSSSLEVVPQTRASFVFKQ